MATVRLANQFHISNGSWGDASDESCCYLPGSSGFDSAYFGISAYVRIAVTDENKVYMKLNGGSCGHDGRELTKGSNDWDVYCGYSAHSFTIISVSGLPNGHFLGTMWADPDPGSGANAGFDFPTSAEVRVGDNASALSSWYYVGNINDLESDRRTYFNLYVAFPVRNTTGEVNFDELDAYKITVTGSFVPEIFEYYPWARLISNEWWSHNRTGGSLKRYNSGWKDIKNVYGSASSSKGFRYNGSSWAVSPKTGRE